MQPGTDSAGFENLPTAICGTQEHSYQQPYHRQAMAGTIFSHFQYFQVEDIWLLCTSWLMTASASSGGEEGRGQDFESYRKTDGKLGVVFLHHGTSSGEHLEASAGEVI